jgi:hypothetical protein
MMLARMMLARMVLARMPAPPLTPGLVLTTRRTRLRFGTSLTSERCGRWPIRSGSPS